MIFATAGMLACEPAPENPPVVATNETVPAVDDWSTRERARSDEVAASWVGDPFKRLIVAWGLPQDRWERDGYIVAEYRGKWGHWIVWVEPDGTMAEMAYVKLNGKERVSGRAVAPTELLPMLTVTGPTLKGLVP